MVSVTMEWQTGKVRESAAGVRGDSNRMKRVGVRCTVPFVLVRDGKG